MAAVVRIKQDLNILAGSGSTEMASLCSSAAQNTERPANARAPAAFPPPVRAEATHGAAQRRKRGREKAALLTLHREAEVAAPLQATVHHKCSMVQTTLHHRACSVCFPKTSRRRQCF